MAEAQPYGAAVQGLGPALEMARRKGDTAAIQHLEAALKGEGHSSSGSSSSMMRSPIHQGTAGPEFSHCSNSYFAIDKLTPKGPRKNADIGSPHDASRPLAKLESTSAGGWWCAAGGWPSPTPRGTTEAFYVFSGHGCLTDADGEQHFMGPGDLVVLPKGWTGRWDVLQDIHKVWFVTDHPDTDQNRNNPKATVVPYSNFAPQYLTQRGLQTGAPDSPNAAFQIVHDNGHMRVGCSTFSTGSFTVSSRPTTECFHVLEGAFFLTNANGSAQRCVAGDTVCLPKQWSGSWDVIAPVKKIWVEVK